MNELFIFESYQFNVASKQLSLNYSYQNGPSFTETYKFDFDFVDYSPETLDRACQLLFLMAGVSYYKAYLAKSISVKSAAIDSSMSEFFSRTYQKGLGEFFYVNSLDPRTPITFPTTAGKLEPIMEAKNNGLLVAIGGGKDSLVSADLLRSQPKIATWSVGHRSQLTPLIERIGLPHLWVERIIDPQLIELNRQGALNGHVPISAILSCVGMVVAILAGYSDVVISNEYSTNEPTLNYQGIDINHQYSKSSEYEQGFQELLHSIFGDQLKYYSFLRPLSEIYIAEIFAEGSFKKYKDVFSSCNRAFRQNQHQLSWCGECPKCAFVFIALTPFISRTELEALWGKNLLLDSSLEPTYRQLLGIEGDKPLECVGEIKESRTAMLLAQKDYPELIDKYHFEIPADYNYKDLAPHSMPEPIADILYQSLTR